MFPQPRSLNWLTAVVLVGDVEHIQCPTYGTALPPRGTLFKEVQWGRTNMTDNVENLVLEPLLAIRSILGEHGDRLNRIELRLSAIEQTLGSLYALSGSDRETISAIIRRVERIERRLELSDHPT